MNQVRKRIGADVVFKHGYTGKGIGVAILDSGISNHPDFSGKIALFKDYVYGKRHNYDDNGHGTHVSGIIAASGERSFGKYRGVAPGVSLYIYKILDKYGRGNTAAILAAIEDVLQRNRKEKIHILNISVGMLNGTNQWERHSVLEAVEKAWEQGIVVVAAAGNNGPGENTVTIPGQSKVVITVGSEEGTFGIEKYGKPLCSGEGPTDQCVVKPEILAPGRHIYSCSAKDFGYEIKSGTSMSAPIVSGSLALLLEKYQDMTPVEVKLRLYQKAIRMEEHRHSWGRIQVEELLKG